MDLPQMLLFLVTAFLVSWISAIAVFGSGLLMVLVASHFYDLKTSLALCVLYFGLNNIQKCRHNWKAIDRSFLRVVLPVALPLCVVGLWGFYYIDINFVRYFLAILCFYIVAAHWFAFVPSFKNLSNFRLRMLAGSWGFMTGLVNAMPIKVLMLQGRGLTKQAFVGTGATISLAVDALKLPGYALMGLYTYEHWSIVLPMLLGSLIGNILGKKCLDRISVGLFEKLVMLMLFLGGLKFLFS